METITKEGIIKALKSVGVRRGQIIYLQSSLYSLGKIEGIKTREEFCKIYYESIFELIGKEGTLVVPTYTTQVARFDIDFIWEETPSLMGTFSEYIRCHPESLRSMHPLKSVTAIGKNKAFICKDNGTSDYGWDSPFHRMLIKKSKILTMGLPSIYVVGIAHHLEAACCLPYVYNKLLKWSPVIYGKRDKKLYFATVRYLDLNIEYDLTLWVKHLRRLGGIKSTKLGGGKIYLSDYEQVFTEGSKKIKENPCYFLKQPPNFKYGKIPFDGPTARKDNVASKSDMAKLKAMNWKGYYLLNKNIHVVDDEW